MEYVEEPGEADCGSEFPAELKSHRAALPPLAATLAVRSIIDPSVSEHEPASAPAGPQPIAGLTCVIEYRGEQRLITCRRFDWIGEDGCIGAICHSARGYRTFRTDRVDGVYDAQTGELLGDGSFFRQFDADGRRDRAPTWGLAPGRRSTLVCGLNVLAFMSRCDGHWHELEAEVIERFVCSMWLRKEWEGDPPIADILVHAERLSPDWQTVCRALNHYAASNTSSLVLRRAVADLIAADGVICEAEHRWAQELVHHLDTLRT